MGTDIYLTQKRKAAVYASRLVEDGMLLGLGSGTTAEEFVRAVGERIASGLRVTGVATSRRTERVAHEVGLPLVELTTTVDLAVDGADAVERTSLSAIKGRGGALTREKLVAHAANQFVIVCDERKVVEHLSDIRQVSPVPIEVLAFGWKFTCLSLSCLGRPVARERDGQVALTDNGNPIVDLYEADLSAPHRLAESIQRIPGVVAHGLFLDMASLALVAGEDGVEELYVVR